MSRHRMRSRQRNTLRTKFLLVAGTTAVFAAAALFFIYFNFSDVQDSKAFFPGDYRAVGSGEWTDPMVWEVYDGDKWIAAEMPPGEGVSNVIVTTGNTMTLSEELVLMDVVIEEGGTLLIESNSIRVNKKKDKGGIVCKGALSLGNAIIEGNADITVFAGATLMIGSDAGIDKKSQMGNIQMKGKKDFSKDATYIFNGTVKQHTGNGLPLVVKNLTVSNSSGVIMDQNFQVTDSLTLNKGHLYTDKNILMVGSSATSNGNLICHEGTFSGNIRYWYGSKKDMRFAFSDGSFPVHIDFSLQSEKYGKGMVEFFYQDGVPDDARKSPFAARQVVVGLTPKGYLSAMTSNGADEAWLQVDEAPGAGDHIKWNITDKESLSRAFAQENEGSVTPVKALSNILAGPNPFSTQLTVRFYSDIKTIANIQLTGPDGKVITGEKIMVQPGYNQFNFRPATPYPAGKYMVMISNSSEIHTTAVRSEGI